MQTGRHLSDVQIVANRMERIAAQHASERREVRAAAVRYATASVGLEGFRTSAESDAIMARYVSGELSLDQMIQEGLALGPTNSVNA